MANNEATIGSSPSYDSSSMLSEEQQEMLNSKSPLDLTTLPHDTLDTVLSGYYQGKTTPEENAAIERALPSLRTYMKSHPETFSAFHDKYPETAAKLTQEDGSSRQLSGGSMPIHQFYKDLSPSPIRDIPHLLNYMKMLNYHANKMNSGDIRMKSLEIIDTDAKRFPKAPNNNPNFNWNTFFAQLPSNSPPKQFLNEFSSEIVRTELVKIANQVIDTQKNCNFPMKEGSASISCPVTEDTPKTDSGVFISLLKKYENMEMFKDTREALAVLKQPWKHEFKDVLLAINIALLLGAGEKS